MSIKKIERLTQAYCNVIDNFFQWVFSWKFIKKISSLELYKSVFRNEKLVLVCLFLIGFLIRITLYLVLSPSYYPLSPSDLTSDSKDYDISAINGITKGEFSIFFQPGVSFLLGAIYLIFGHNIVIASLVLIVIGSSVGMLAYFTSKSVFSHEGIAYSSFILIAVYPYLVFESPRIMSDTLALFIFASVVYYTIIDFTEKRQKYSPIIGFLTGILMLTRPNYFWVPILYLILLVNSSKNGGYAFLVKKCILFSITFLMVMTPWIMYTDTQLGEPTLTTNGGVNFYIGNNQNSTGRFCTPFGLEETINEVTRSKEGFKKGFSYILNNPTDYFLLCIKKIYLLIFIPQRLPFEMFSHKFSASTELLFSIGVNLGFIVTQFVGIRGIIYSKEKIKDKQIYYYMIGSLLLLYIIPIVFFVQTRAIIPIIYIWILFLTPYLQYIMKT
jgi:4-amino-4-deoxy-L-arabinose transferase-like glycosyltransferase